MSALTFFVSPMEVEIAVRLPWGAAGGDAWDLVAATFLDVALNGRGVWIASLADPSNLDWADVVKPGAGIEHLTRSVSGRNAEIGYVESFDERAAQSIIRSGDFEWDSVFLFPRKRDELNDVISTLAKIDVRSQTFAGVGEFVFPVGDGIGLRWIHPGPSADIERIKRVSIEQGFTLQGIASAGRTMGN